MATFGLGWFLTIVGALFVLLGLIGAARETFTIPPPTLTFWAGIPDLLKGFAEVIKAIATAPRWLGLTVVGVFLIYAGQRLVAGLSILPSFT